MSWLTDVDGLEERRGYQRDQRAALAAQAALSERLAVEVCCRECGCSESLSCPEGCGWVGPDLCSACAPDREPSPAVSGVLMAEAAEIQAELSSRLSVEVVAWWWRSRRRELDDRSPRVLVDELGAAAGPRLLALAREDMFSLAGDLAGADELAQRAAVGDNGGSRS